MQQISKTAFVLAAFMMNFEVQAENLFADGGFQTTTDIACSDSWEYKFEDKSVVTLSGCVDIEEFPVYPTVGTTSTVNLNEPLDSRTTKQKYCATADRYNAFNVNSRENWGYCLDKDLAFDETSLDEGLYADGGYQSSPVSCVAGEWSFKEKIGDENVLTSLNGCVSFDDYKPFPFYEEDQAEIDALLPALSAKTDTSKWCFVAFDDRNVYNPTPSVDANKLQWGYCLEVKDVDITDPPTDEPATESPTTESPTTSAPATKPPTDGPQPTNPPVDSPATDSPTNDYEYTSYGPTVLPTTYPTNFANKPPTVVDVNPGTSPKSSDDPSGGLIAGVTVAVILVVVAMVLAGLFAYSAYKKKQSSPANTFKQTDIEENEPKSSGIF